MIAIKKRYLSAFPKAFIIDIRKENPGKGDELIRGLDLAKRYWEEVGRPRFEAECPQLFTRGAVGLAGEGSECFGFDDEISRDHDWGPGFCVWLSDADMDA
ncbi:MAG: hypothetical protein LUE31_01940 [Lachnospiraceae bacterium]|nr:hypothetical protein [Lachnospiraceae bacterium]